MNLRFVASTGFQTRFCKRHAIRNLGIQGEQASVDVFAACEFQVDFSKTIKEYDHHLVFNCDETGLQFHLLPSKTLASIHERRAEGRKKTKERVTVTINVCANITGSIKLPLLMIGKAAHPCCFNKLPLNSLPVTYRGKKKTLRLLLLFFGPGLMMFLFPLFQKKQWEMGIPPKALLG